MPEQTNSKRPSVGSNLDLFENSNLPTTPIKQFLLS